MDTVFTSIKSPCQVFPLLVIMTFIKQSNKLLECLQNSYRMSLWEMVPVLGGGVVQNL